MGYASEHHVQARACTQTHKVLFEAFKHVRIVLNNKTWTKRCTSMNLTFVCYLKTIKLKQKNLEMSGVYTNKQK